jgi:hypothetical protein
MKIFIAVSFFLTLFLLFPNLSIAYVGREYPLRGERGREESGPNHYGYRYRYFVVNNQRNIPSWPSYYSYYGYPIDGSSYYYSYPLNSAYYYSYPSYYTNFSYPSYPYNGYYYINDTKHYSLPPSHSSFSYERKYSAPSRRFYQARSRVGVFQK